MTRPTPTATRASRIPDPDAAKPAPAASDPSESTFGNLWKMAWPLVAAMFLQFSVGLTDTYVAGRFGPEVQAAVGFAAQLLFVFGVLGNALGIGVVALVARSHGAGDAEAGWNASRQALLVAAAATVPLSLAGALWRPSGGALSFLPPAAAQAAAALLPIYALSLAPQALLMVAGAIFRAQRHVGLVLLSWGATACLNLWAVFAFAFGQGPVPPLGVRGIAVATTTATLLGALLSLGLLFRLGLRGHRAHRWRPDAAMIRSLWRLAWPAGILQVGWNLSGVVLYGLLGRLGAAALPASAALANGLRIEAVLYLPAFALNMVAAVLVGQALGARKVAHAEQVGWRVAGAGTLVLTALSVPVFLFSRELAAFVSPEPAVRAATSLYLRIAMLSQPFMACSICLGGALQGAGDTRSPMTIVLGFVWAVRLPLAALLGLATPLGAAGIWWAMAASQVLQSAGMAVRFARGRWKSGGLRI